MFSQDSVGKRVISTHFGTGTIIDVSSNAYFPVYVSFDTHPTIQLFTIKGHFTLGKGLRDRSITLLSSKKGTPEARHIVAMLARALRTAKTKTFYKQDDSYAVGYVEALGDAYQQAKQLLGENE